MTRPTITSATVHGTRVRLTAMATNDAIENKATNVTAIPPGFYVEEGTAAGGNSAEGDNAATNSAAQRCTSCPKT